LIGYLVQKSIKLECLKPFSKRGRVKYFVKIHLHAGFMLFELIVTVVLVAFLLLLGGSLFSGLQRLLVGLETKKLAVTCRCLQYQALSSNVEQHLFFDQVLQGYRFNGHDERLARGVLFGRGDHVVGSPSRPHQQVSSAITFVNQQINFFPSGIVQAGTVYLTTYDKMLTYALSAPISQFSFLRIYRYNGKWNLVS
jgi:hypothetical protein